LKSCFLPANDITSDQQLEQNQRWYLQMRDTMDRHSDKLFILLTTPPVNPAETNPAAAARARQLAQWLASDAFIAGHPNVAVFDLYSYLAETNPAAPDFGMLRLDYRKGDDSHPNRLAMETVGPVLVDFVVGTIDAYQSSLKLQTPIGAE
jgi:hypothetical protein